MGQGCYRLPCESEKAGTHWFRENGERNEWTACGGKLRSCVAPRCASCRPSIWDCLGSPRAPITNNSYFGVSPGDSQAVAYGELSDRARQQALAIAQDVDLRIKAPTHLVGVGPALLEPTLRSRHRSGRDGRLPKPGSLLQRKFKGQIVVVQVLADGFQYQDRYYKSLSAIARQVTGTRWNGYAFFGLRILDGGSS